MFFYLYKSVIVIVVMVTCKTLLPDEELPPHGYNDEDSSADIKGRSFIEEPFEVRGARLFEPPSTYCIVKALQKIKNIRYTHKLQTLDTDVFCIVHE